MSVPDDILPTHKEQTLLVLKAQGEVNHVIFDRHEAKPGETLHVHVPKLGESEGFVPGSLALVFDIDLSGQPRQQLSAPERLTGAYGPAESEVWVNGLKRHKRLRHVQDLQ